MFKNYLLTGLRAQKRQKWYSLLNILGLTIGIATAIFILAYVRDDLRWDHFVSKGDRLYRLIQVQTFNSEKGDPTPFTMPAIGPAMKEQIIGIEDYVRTTGMWKCSLRRGEVKLNENYRYADPNLLELIDYPLISGDSKTALSRPESIVLTEEVAKKFFGDEDPMGHTMIIEGGREVIVTGVLGTPETHTHFEQNVIVPMESMLLDKSWMKPDHLNSWGWFNFYTYILLKEGALLADVNSQLPTFFEEHYDPSEQQFYLQPFLDIHLNSGNGLESMGTNSNYTTVYGLFFIAIFILLIACINFINMSTAQSIKRAREVGMRKVAGATRKGLVFQFITESMIVAIFAMLVAAVVVELSEPLFQQLSGRITEINILDGGFVTFTLLGLTFLTGIFSGLYPAFVISRPQPVQILKGGLASHKTPWVRRGLVAIQFTISIYLLISTGIITKQVHYLNNKDLGYNKEGIFLLFLNSKDFNRNLEDNIAQIDQIPGVLHSTCVNKFPGRLGNITGVGVEGKTDAVMMHDMEVTPGFEKVFQCRLDQGRFFDETLKTDWLSKEGGSSIINETAVELFGWEEPLGKTLTYNGIKTNVIGVIKDFHFTSLHQPIEPMIIVMDVDWRSWACMRVDLNQTNTVIKGVEKIWEDVAPESPFQYMFLDEFHESFYRNESLQARTFNVFSGIAIFIACLGLIGLAAYAVNTRSREISVRKVLGASVQQILMLLGREYLWIVIISGVIASPFAFYFMHKWMDSFAYKTDMSWWIFILATAVALVVALVTVVGQGIRAALKNPASALRHE